MQPLALGAEALALGAPRKWGRKRRNTMYLYVKWNSSALWSARRRSRLDKRQGALKSDLLFQSKAGKPLHQSNVLRRTLHPILENLNELKCGCHAFRRFRITHLRKNGVPEDLIHFWVGHAGKSVTDDYSKLKDDLEFRKEVTVRAGLGFELPSRKKEVGPNGPKIETEACRELAASV